MKLEEKIAELKKRDLLAEEGGGAQRRERQHKEGKMSARERIDFLLDDGSFEASFLPPEKKIEFLNLFDAAATRA